jgi:TonB family protein
MSCPDPLRPYNPFEDASSPHADFDVHGDLPSDAEIRGLTSTLAANGGGDASKDLALDLVLNQIVEQACLATGATGAAIALTRDGEMVCRATTGRTAPDLGVRLDNAGFSAECLRVGTLQRCDDTETDPRVDAGACRLLGVRSILVVPLWYWGEFMGIFEIFSPRPNAFGERDEQTLQALAYRIVRHTKESSGQIAGFTAAREEVPAFAAPPPPKATREFEPEPEPERPRPNVVELRPKIVIPSPPDQWTTFLMTCAGFIAVIIVALMLWRLQWNRAAAEKTARPSASEPQIQELDLGPPAAVAAASPEQETPPPVPPQPKPRKSVSAGDVVISAVEKKAVAPPVPAEVGLAIYDKDGKLIYGTPIADPNQPEPAKKTSRPISSAAKPASQIATPAALLSKSPADASTPDLIDGRYVRLKPELAEGLLADRVEPEYPDAARRAHIQGSVTLETLIGANGRVQQVTPVSGNPQLADAAVNAVRQWRYKPFTVDGHKVPIRTQVTVTFMLAQ